MRGPADVDLEGRSLRGVSLVDGGERDPHAQARRHRPARDVAHVGAAGNSSKPGSPVYPVRVAKNAARPPETVGSPGGAMAGPGDPGLPHPSISGGTARGWAPHGAGGTKSIDTPWNGLTWLRSTDVKRCRSSGARGPCTARHRNSVVRSASATSRAACALSHSTTAVRGPALHTRKNRSGARHVTMTSSRIVPSPRRRCVYRALPGDVGTSFALR